MRCSSYRVIWITAITLIEGELISYFIFKYIKKKLGPEQEIEDHTMSVRSNVKGILERLLLLVGLLNNFPHILIAFAGLKIGTRLYDDHIKKISNDYFLVGNSVSILIAMLYAIIIKHICN